MKYKIVLFFTLFSIFATSQVLTKQDTLIGSNHAYRSWWDAKSYILSVKPDYKTKTISGNNIIAYTVVSDSLPLMMQLDLQSPMKIDSIFYDNKKINSFINENNRWMLSLENQTKNSNHFLTIYFSGKPKEAKNAPWDGGWVWKKDSLGNPWISAACQGIGASVWYPCKDLQSDEISEAKLSITVPDTLVAIGNGKLQTSVTVNHLTTYIWSVSSPINNYNIIPYIGKYTLLHDSVKGVNGNLITDYWVLDYHVGQAKKHLKPNVTKTIACLEDWFGPYPFYNDSYKIVEAPYLGMEHQSNVAYGNNYQNGYVGEDLSKSGWGLKWDFIVVHETAHEWFGNSITAKDVADNWIHEGFASYAEVLFTECEFGKQAGAEYCRGVKKSINNDAPIVGRYGVKKEGSGDMYNKGSQVIHMIRQMINNDEKFKSLLHQISSKYYHQCITSNELELFITQFTNLKLESFFNQYLRSANVPEFQYKIKRNKLSYRYANCVTGFFMPINVSFNNKLVKLSPSLKWQTIKDEQLIKGFGIDEDFYLSVKKYSK